jgi:hypothetical protein
MKMNALPVLAVVDAGGQEQAKNPNEFEFPYGNIKTTIALQDDSFVIRKIKVDDKTKRETPKGKPATIPRSALAQVKITRTFSPMAIVAGLMIGGGLGGILAVILGMVPALVAIALGVVFGVVTAFPKMMVILRKDGTKYKVVLGDGEAEYERLIGVLYK